jgi:hypothetical protein
MIQSTFRIKLDFFSSVIFSILNAKFKWLFIGNFSANSNKILHLLSELNFDFTLCQIHGILIPLFFIEITKVSGEIQSLNQWKKYFAAQSIAQPNFGQIVVSHAIKLDFKSFQALAVIIALVAHETAGQ